MTFCKTNKTKKVFLIALALIFVSASSQIFAKTAEAIDAGVKVTLETLKSKVGSEKLNKAYGVLVFPEVYKAGVGIGGEYGEGALLRNGRTVSYYSTVSASVGWQFGGQKRQSFIYLTQKKPTTNL